MKPFTIAASAAILATSAAVLYAAMPAMAAPGWDKNAVMTWAEVKTKSDAMWTKLDVNKDGVLSQADRDAKFGQKFDEIDTNHDGQISREEWTAHHRAMMERGHGPMGAMAPDGPMGGPPPMEGMDHDGPMGRHGKGRGGMGHGGMRHPGMAMMAHEMLMAADTNKDGQITRAEFDAAVKARFDKADTNHDGKVSPEERRAAMVAMRRAGPPMGDMPPPPPNGM
jgi:Ca2+-binding EF-hand superfamily protein